MPQELNEIDWKGGLSDKTDRLGQHICAFANLKGVDAMVVGVEAEGRMFGVRGRVAILNI